MRQFVLFFVAIFLVSQVNAFADSKWQTPIVGFSASKVRLIQTSYYNEKGEKSHIYALHFKLKKNWKLYGKNSDGIGIALNLDFANSKNVKNHIIYWPKAQSVTQDIGDEIIKYETYEDEVVLPLDLFGDIKNFSKINFKLIYGVCNKICVPAINNIEFIVDKTIKEENFALIEKYMQDFKMNLYQKGFEPEERDISQNGMPITVLCYALFAAFMGGLILNIMPCVLPVLSIKLISILKHNNSNIKAIRLSFLATVAGILFSFLAFGGLVSAVSYSGDVFNWGLQFQNPFFLTFLIAIFVIFIANILGFFQINDSAALSNYLNKKIDNNLVKRKIFIANFLSGILAVLLATPCSAPFLGVAISFSVTQSAMLNLLIFVVMGIGFAAPYLILIIFPRLIKSLPKSGSWTGMVKNILASFIVVTAIWLCYLLYRNSGLDSSLVVAALSIALLFSFKVKYKLLQTLLVLTLAMSIFLAPAGVDNISKNESNITKDMVWSSFEGVEIDKYVALGKTVVIDVTADWCLTCKFNKYKVLNDEDVVKLLKSDHVIAMRADITKPDKMVMDFVNSYDRYAIPFNIVFGPNAKDGILTSELLDKEDFISIIKKASK